MHPVIKMYKEMTSITKKYEHMTMSSYISYWGRACGRARFTSHEICTQQTFRILSNTGRSVHKQSNLPYGTLKFKKDVHVP